MLYDELISIYTKEYNHAFKSKDQIWSQKCDYKNLKDLDYQRDHLQPAELMLPKQVKITGKYLMRYRVQSLKLKIINQKLLQMEKI